ncbi:MULTISPECIES: DUF4145 domain-containing protein [Streptococcus]|nr:MULTISPECIES: DUF4145 domain-containing protein [Streptococcus]MBF0776000.1 DUF4145 domain-containing protein [Streptococcus sp. 19428wD3_AN2]MBF0787988.1 DUF4145 domain-containing protein [Streptococcus sp. 19428wC2_LYSM12]QBX22503.1 hypothetical protein Javan85_0006 [Streptococcus phage Javan85]QBX31930.1 hypothetical protein Javan84_0053 [Streptococcus phage Javan84]
MEISKINYYINDLSSNKAIEIPKACPNCGIGNNPTTSNISSMDTKEGKVIGLFHRCTACQKSHMTLQEYHAGNDYTTMAIVYPNKVITDIDPLFIECAPRFVEFYSEAIEAEKIGLENIAGTGYRSAIECLVKDYALYFELDTKEYLSDPKFSFNNAIDRYVKDDDLLKGVLHFIREVGNHYTHWDKDTNITLPVLKTYVEIILQIFKSKFMLKNLPTV